MMPAEFSREALLELAHYRMPYGRYQGRYLTDLPVALPGLVPPEGLPGRETGPAA